ncbi:unnamed protein product [Meganyctiphanes norvegica]|uniref:SGNH hydrolase-type esterase domain-containing protein n=1 Tax=Meganyctiphanes norvegica TaxID=48144 RepID=A0AAV2SJ67_MEGNR
MAMAAMARALQQDTATCGFLGASHMRDTYRKIGLLLGLGADGYGPIHVRGGITAREYNASIAASVFATPDVMVIWLGTNDCNPRNDADYQNCYYVVENMKDILEYYDRRGVCVYLVGLVPMR